MILNLILIQIIITYCIGMSGFVGSVKELISKLLTKQSLNFSFKPFDCPQCLTFWVGLIYLLIAHHFTIPYIAFVCLLSYFTTITQDLLFLIKDAIIFALNKINDLIYDKR